MDNHIIFERSFPFGEGHHEITNFKARSAEMVGKAKQLNLVVQSLETKKQKSSDERDGVKSAIAQRHDEIAATNETMVQNGERVSQLTKLAHQEMVTLQNETDFLGTLIEKRSQFAVVKKFSYKISEEGLQLSGDDQFQLKSVSELPTAELPSCENMLFTSIMP